MGNLIIIMKIEKQTAQFTKQVACEVEYWYDDGSDISYGDLAYIQSQIDEGYIEGELVYENGRGWWKLL